MKEISLKKTYDEYEKINLCDNDVNSKIYILNVIGKINTITISDNFNIKIRNLNDNEIKRFITFRDKNVANNFQKNNFEIFSKVEQMNFDDEIINNFFEEEKIKLVDDLDDNEKSQLSKLYLFCKNIIIIDLNYNKVFDEFKNYNSYFYNNNLTYLYESEEVATIESFVDGLTKLISIFIC